MINWSVNTVFIEKFDENDNLDARWTTRLKRLINIYKLENGFVLIYINFSLNFHALNYLCCIYGCPQVHFNRKSDAIQIHALYHKNKSIYIYAFSINFHVNFLQSDWSTQPDSHVIVTGCPVTTTFFSKWRLTV